MIVGIGADLAEIRRFYFWAQNPVLVGRFFHPAEQTALGRISSLAGAAQFLAGRFAAKEAFAKSLGTGFRGMALSEICVENNPQGKPVLTLWGRARDVFARHGAAKAHISLSHDGGWALAFVILET